MTAKQPDLSAIRTSYEMARLREEDIVADPTVQFQRWFDEAMERKVMEPTAMTLSTASAAGRPSSRIVLLKQLDNGRFGFFTNYESRKGQELASNPFAALLFFWPELQRQVRVEGYVERMTSDLSDRYFQSRPRGSKLGAIASPQSRGIPRRSELDAHLAKLEVEYEGVEDIPRPCHWGGYWLSADTIEFWQGGGNRLHDRIVYTKQGTEWNISRLAP